jgi:hypothetical protein
MEYEEKNEENVYTHHMKSIRAASEQLLCEVYVGIGTSTVNSDEFSLSIQELHVLLLKHLS